MTLELLHVIRDYTLTRTSIPNYAGNIKDVIQNVVLLHSAIILHGRKVSVHGSTGELDKCNLPDSLVVECSLRVREVQGSVPDGTSGSLVKH